jgi:hypothetical protein
VCACVMRIGNKEIVSACIQVYTVAIIFLHGGGPVAKLCFYHNLELFMNHGVVFDQARKLRVELIPMNCSKPYKSFGEMLSKSTCPCPYRLASKIYIVKIII